MDNNIWVKSSATLAKRLHQGQVDKAGVEYFEGHLCMVVSMGTTWLEHVVGYLLEEEVQPKLSKEDRLALFFDSTICYY